MMDYLEIGPTPACEDCQQVGTASYDPDVATLECRVFLRYLVRILSAECERRGYRDGDHAVSLRIRSHAHDFGTYREVAVRYDEEDPEAVDLAYWLEANAPDTWDDAARSELDREIRALSERRAGWDPVAHGA